MSFDEISKVGFIGQEKDLENNAVLNREHMGLSKGVFVSLSGICNYVEGLCIS